MPGGGPSTPGPIHAVAVFGPARGRWIPFFVFTLAVLAVVLSLRGGDGRLLAGWEALAGLAGAAVLAGWQVLDPRPRLVIDDTGVADRALRVGVMEWDDIRGAELAAGQALPVLCLHVRDEAKYLRRLSPVGRWLVRSNRMYGRPALSLNLAGVAADPEVVLGLIRRGIAARGGARDG